ncbi:ankyrin repeat domain-containing protein [bacterium]|jgi:hypothetical protein|nr:ankyrin repeat domain-containing protein [bacterium]
MFSFIKKIKEFFGILSKDYDTSNLRTERVRQNFEITPELLDHHVRLSKMDTRLVHGVVKFIANSKNTNLINIMHEAISSEEYMLEKIIAFFGKVEIYLDWKEYVRGHAELFEYVSKDEKISKKFLMRIPRVFANDCLIMAAKNGNFELFKYIVENIGGSVLYKQGKPMRAAIITGNNESYITKEDRLNIVKYCIEDKGCPAYICAYDGLKKACKHGLYKIVRFFVEECDCRVDLYKNYLLNNSTDEIKRYLSEKINENSSNLACSQ